MIKTLSMVKDHNRKLNEACNKLQTPIQKKKEKSLFVNSSTRYALEQNHLDDFWHMLRCTLMD